MNLTFELAIVLNCVLQIKDTTREYSFSEYMEESSEQYVKSGQFKYSDTYTINVIKYKPYLSNNAEILDVIITSHLDELGNIVYLDEAYYPLQKDGHYIIDHIVIPSTKLAEKLIVLEEQNAIGTNGINDYSNFYASDGTILYKYVNGIKEECTIEELISVNSEQSNISKVSLETFSICFLHKCYLEHCKSEFEKLIKERCFTNNTFQNYITDLIWISINAIKYNIEFGRLEQALSILEDLMRCGEFCKPEKLNNYDCNCCK